MLTEEQDQEARKKLEGCNRWRMDVELTFDILPEDTQERAPGDTAEDFSMRAMYRVKEDLNALLKNSQFAHYHIKVLPNPCIEFD